MVLLVENLLKGGLALIVAMLAMFWLCYLALVLPLTRVGIMALFVAAFVVVSAVGSGAALLAIDFLYLQAVEVSGFLGLLRLVVPASLASVLLFDLLLEGLVLRVLRRWGMGMPAIEIVEVAAGGLVTAVSLAIVARLMPDAGLSAAAALAAGLIGAFVRYFVELFLSDTNLGDTDFIEDVD